MQSSLTLTEELAKLGLKPNDSAVYLAVLELGEPTVGAIQKKTGLHKQLIYNSAENLRDLGLLNIHEIRGRKRFTVENPSALEEQAQIKLDKAKQVTPALFNLANKKRSADSVRVYRGAKAVQQYYLDSIRRQPKKSSVKILGVNSERYFEIFKPDELPYQRFEKLRTSKEVGLCLLLFGKKEDEIRQNQSRKYIDLKVLADNVQGPMDLMVWEGHVGMLFYGEDPYVLDISGTETVTGFEEYFKVLWERGEKTA